MKCTPVIKTSAEQKFPFFLFTFSKNTKIAIENAFQTQAFKHNEALGT